MPSPNSGPNRHRILRQVLDLDIGPGSAGPEFQERVARAFWERTVPELEGVFDRFAGPELFLRLDRLEIDLGDIQGPGWEREFRRRLVERLTRSLAARSVPEAGGGPAGSHEDRAAAALRQFLFFLVHGRLPWWGGRPGAAWPEALLPGIDAAGWKAFRQVLRGDSRPGLRLIDCVSDGFLAAAVAAWTGLPASQEVLASLTPAGRPGAEIRQWRRDFWATLLDWIMADGLGAGQGRVLMEKLLRLREPVPRSAEGDEQPESWAMGNRALGDPAEADAPPALPQPWREWLDAARPRPPSGPEPATWTASSGPSLEPPEPSATARFPELSGEADGQAAAGREIDAQAPGAPKPSAALPAPGRDSEGGQPTWVRDGEAIHREGGGAGITPGGNAGWRQPVSARGDQEAIYLEGAGAVILHPFLEELFRRRGWLEKRDFRNQEARQRAVRLLGFLSFGSEGVAEYDLVLAKLLCGLPFEEPLAPAELDEDDRTACDDLLDAVLRHWTALRSSSPEWLRFHFFLREGKLEAVDDGWRLTVERRAQDVLLARLPWGLGVITLPWMEGRIYVHWVD